MDRTVDDGRMDVCLDGWIDGCMDDGKMIEKRGIYGLMNGYAH